MGVTLGLGIGSDESASFRIGHMGHVNAPAILGVLGSIETALTSLGAPLGSSGCRPQLRRCLSSSPILVTAIHHLARRLVVL